MKINIDGLSKIGYNFHSIKGILTLRHVYALLRGGIAQLAEQLPFKQLVQGSSPCAPTVIT